MPTTGAPETNGVVLAGTRSAVGRPTVPLAALGRPAADSRFAFDVARGDGVDGAHDGLLEHRTLGSYTHLHAASGAFDTFLARVSR